MPAAVPTPVEAAPAEPVAKPASEQAADKVPAKAVQVAGATSGLQPFSPNLSPWSMFLHADIIVQGVMCGLAFASLVTWTVLIAKSVELLSARRHLRTALQRAAAARTLGEAEAATGRKRTVLSALLTAALLEARLSQQAGAGSEDGVRGRAASLFADISRSEGRAMRRGMGLLATIGSTSPFVGLFGTVWGIMNSFIGISKAQTTNLAVVAPGIAEALLATAIGLVAAIPAVIIYNHFSRQLRGYLDTVAQATGLAGRLLSRDLDAAQGRPLIRAAE